MKYRIQIILEMDVEIDQPLDEPRFHFEEHRCVDDFLVIALDDVMPDSCNCYRANIKLLHDGRSEVLSLMDRRKHNKGKQ